MWCDVRPRLLWIICRIRRQNITAKTCYRSIVPFRIHSNFLCFHFVFNSLHSSRPHFPLFPFAQFLFSVFFFILSLRAVSNIISYNSTWEYHNISLFSTGLIIGDISMPSNNGIFSSMCRLSTSMPPIILHMLRWLGDESVLLFSGVFEFVVELFVSVTWPYALFELLLHVSSWQLSFSERCDAPPFDSSSSHSS